MAWTEETFSNELIKQTSEKESLQALTFSIKGDSGTNGTGIDVSGAAMITPTIPARKVICDGAGNFSFVDLGGNSHVIQLAAKGTIEPIGIAEIYPDSWAVSGLRTTATGVHLF